MPISVGPKLLEVLTVAVQADVPTLLIGGTGIGKSQIVEALASKLGVRHLVRDLSLMEPSDLIGMPIITDHATHKSTSFAAPAFLPRDGRGILMFEELNRAPPYMLAPTLELLTSRRLNDYVLPPGWVPMAAINPATDDAYVGTRQLDAALEARFMKIEVTAAAKEWVVWAEAHDVHPDVISFVRTTPQIFVARESNPRAWTMVSKVLQSARSDQHDQMLLPMLTGLVGESMAVSFLRFMRGDRGKLIKPQDVLRRYAIVAKQVKALATANDTAALHALVHGVLITVQDPDWRTTDADEMVQRRHLEAFAKDLPAEFRRRIQEHLDDA